MAASVNGRNGESYEGRISLLFSSERELMDLHRLIQTIPRLEILFESLDGWIANSFEDSELSELLSSDLGLSLFIEHLPPKAWFYSDDVVILAGLELERLHRALVDRGQRRFVVVMPPDEATSSSLMEYLSQCSVTEDLVVSADMFPTIADIKTLVGDSWPKLGILSPEVNDFERGLVEHIVNLLASACIQATTQKWLPQLTTEQYLTNLPRLSELPSIMQCEDFFRDAQVIIVSPGPSLREDLEVLKTIHHSFVVVAALKALDALLDAEIVPDFAIWQDPRDHSNHLPKHQLVSEVSLILSDSCHSSFLSAPFKAHYVYSDFQLSCLPTAAVIHGGDGIRAGASSVSTVACLLALGLGCRGITLIGQDLHISRGHYVLDSITVTDDTKEQLNTSQALTCEGIDGSRLETLPNYLSFIQEFEQIAAVHPDRGLLNCTSHGAFLAGWMHIPLSEITSHVDTVQKKNTQIGITPVPKGRKADLIKSCQAIQNSLRLWLQSSELASDQLLHALQERDFKAVSEMHEVKLKALLGGECQVLKYYCAGI